MRNLKTVLVLALILASLAAGFFFGVKTAISRLSAKSVMALSEMAGLRAALDIFRIHAGRFPTTAESLAVLRKPQFRGPFIARDSSLLDPWGRPYIYGLDFAIDPNGVPTITSLAKDGLVGGVGENTDLKLWLNLNIPVSTSSLTTKPTARPSP